MRLASSYSERTAARPSHRVRAEALLSRTLSARIPLLPAEVQNTADRCAKETPHRRAPAGQAPEPGSWRTVPPALGVGSPQSPALPRVTRATSERDRYGPSVPAVLQNGSGGRGDGGRRRAGRPALPSPPRSPRRPPSSSGSTSLLEKASPRTELSQTEARGPGGCARPRGRVPPRLRTLSPTRRPRRGGLPG